MHHRQSRFAELEDSRSTTTGRLDECRARTDTTFPTYEENGKRIQSLDRELKRKPRDPTMFRGNAEDRPLLDRDGDRLLRLDITDLTAEEAIQVGDWAVLVTGAEMSSG